MTAPYFMQQRPSFNNLAEKRTVSCSLAERVLPFQVPHDSSTARAPSAVPVCSFVLLSIALAARLSVGPRGAAAIQSKLRLRYRVAIACHLSSRTRLFTCI